MATKAEVEFWKDMCRKLTGIMDRQDEIYTEVMSRLNARTEELKSLQAIVDGLEWQVEDLQKENDKLREKIQRQADELTALRRALEQRNGEVRPWKKQAERFVAENAALERRIDELCVEVERLHAERDAWKLNAARLRGQNDEIVNLAKLLWQLVPKPNCEWDMDANLCTGYDKCHGECGILGDMRKLGIEVE